MQTNSLVNQIILLNKELSHREIAALVWDECGEKLSEEAVRKRLVRMRATIEQEMAIAGIDPEKVTKFWHKGKTTTFEVKQSVTYESFRDALIEDLRKAAPKRPRVKRKKTKERHLLILDPADMHFGKLGCREEVFEEYNMKIARERMLDGCAGIVREANRYSVEKIILVLGNDLVHTDTPKRTTTSGTPQDTDGMWWQAYKSAQACCVSVIDSLLPVADIEVVYCPSNHDFMLGFCLLDSIQGWYHNYKQITFDCRIAHRKYRTYGDNLLGFSHGDGAKLADTPLLMATEAADFSKCRHRNVYLHHFHHMKKVQFLNGEDKIGVTVEYLRSASGPDRWHFTQGYTGVPKAVEGFIHHPQDGQVGKICHKF